MAIAWVEGHPFSAPCRVHSQAPLFLKTVDPFIQRQHFPLFGTMLWEEEGRIVRADAELSHLQKWETGALIEVKGVRSEPLDRRRHQRVPIDSSVTIRLVDESSSGPEISLTQGRLIDISQGGAHVQLGSVPLEGTLLEFNVKTDSGELIKSLAVVVKARRESVGIAFLDAPSYVQDSLARWLENVA